MEHIQVQGKRLKAAKVRGLLFSLANSIKRSGEVIGSVDADKYAASCSFVIDDMILGLSISNLKGGEL